VIRIRKHDGSATETNDPTAFVELVNDADGTVMLSFLQIQPGAILQIKPGTSDAIRYEEMFKAQGVIFSKTMIVRESQ